MAQSSELAGGSGFTFANLVAARYLAALLTEHAMPGAGGIVTGVSVEQRDFGEPLDDVIIDSRLVSGADARLSLQCKSSLTISAAARNSDFREIIRDSVKTLRKPNFRNDLDRFGAAVNTVAAGTFNTLTDICEWARESDTFAHFAQRFTPGGNASASHSKMKDVIGTLVTDALGQEFSEELLYRFLRHFVLIRFDHLHEGSVDSPEAINAVRPALRPADSNQAGALWAALCDITRKGAGRAAQYSRAGIVVRLGRTIALAGAASLRGDLDKLSELAADWASDIENDVRGTRLTREKLAKKFSKLLVERRFIQVRGLPGCGKSVLLRQSVEASLKTGPVVFLKSDRLEGRSWASFARSVGLSSAPLRDLLVEVSAVGSPVLYIDGIDRVEKERHGVIVDVVRAILTDKLLEPWRIVVSLRDSGLEPVRTWLPDLFETGRLTTIDVGVLDDDEAKQLATERPELAPLLQVQGSVQEIVRRPFFAKVLSQALGSANGTAITPASETDLIEIWWTRGGFNAQGAGVTARQRTILELAGLRVRALSEPIMVAGLTPAAVAGFDELVADGVLQPVRAGHSVRFSHDIFFEWALYHRMVSRGAAWPNELRDAGEPPVIGRVIELLSQADFVAERGWDATLDQLDKSGLRTQWTRAWLLGPLATPTFSIHKSRYFAICAKDKYRWLAKALVWFQAEKTAPNPSILDGTVGSAYWKRHEIVRFADALAWPADFRAWRRMLSLVLANIDSIPLSLAADVVVLFEVWENVFRGYPNDVSSKWLDQAATWLIEIEAVRHTKRSLRELDVPSPWSDVSFSLESLEGTLRSLLLRSASVKPDAVTTYLTHLLADKWRLDQVFSDLVGWSNFLAPKHGALLAEISLLHFREELPQARMAREQAEEEADWARRAAARAKPERERTRLEERMLDMPYTLGRGGFDRSEWENLAVDRDFGEYFPPSPLRQPFHALFESASDEGLRVVKELSNHATTAWRQLHKLDLQHQGTPIPIELEFPWGKQYFWGNGREYLWGRGLWAPKPLAGAYMALEKWAIGQLDAGASADAVIEKLVRGNEAVAVLAVAVSVALKSQAVSEVTLPLYTSQRLWDYDLHRNIYDRGEAATASMIGFDRPSDRPHADAVIALNNMPFRKRWLREYITLVLLPGRGALADRARKAILLFPDDLPFEYEEQKAYPEANEALLEKARFNTEFGKTENFQVTPIPGDDTMQQVMIDNPLSRTPEAQDRMAQTVQRQTEQLLWFWADQSIQGPALKDGIDPADAVARAKAIDENSLFETEGDRDTHELGIQRGAVAGVAAVVLKYSASYTSPDLAWARDILRRAAVMPEEARDSWSSSSIIDWHPGVSAARGFSFDLRAGHGGDTEAEALLRLVAHPLETVSLNAQAVCFQLWDTHPRLGWCALWLSLACCRISVLPGRDQGLRFNPGFIVLGREPAVADAVAHLRKAGSWPALPAMPAAWKDMGEDAGDRRWHAPDIEFEWGYGSKVVKIIPAEQILNNHDARGGFSAFLQDARQWLLSKISPPWQGRSRDRDRRQRVGQFDDAFGHLMAKCAPALTSQELDGLFFDPVLALEGELCYQILSPFLASYVCVAVYDAANVSQSALVVLGKCLDRVLQDPTFAPSSYRDGELYGYELPRMIRALLFVSAQADGATRFANGDWTDVAVVMPIVDRLIRATGFSAAVMTDYLSLVERAQAIYPAESFADQVLAVLVSGRAALIGWRELVLPARIAGLVQGLSYRDTPMAPAIAQKLLRILDILVDMGDRRSAALQNSDSFREVRLDPVQSSQQG